MKKTLALVLVLVLVVPVFGCAFAEEDARTEITWMSWGHSRPQEIRNEALALAFPELAEQYVITPIVAGTGVPDVADKLRMMLASNTQLPDIFQLNSILFKEFAQAGVSADVTDAFASVADELMPGVRDLCTYEGRQVAFPYCLNTLMWFYRDDMYAEAGIDIDQIANVDGLIAAGQQLKAKYPDSYLFEMSPGHCATMFSWLMNGSGISYYDADKGAYALSGNEQILAILQDIRKLQQSGVVSDVNQWNPDWEQAFADGTLAGTLLCNWFTDAAFLPNYAPETKGKWSARVWPEIGGVDMGSENGGAMIFVTESSPNKDAAIEILSKLCFTTEGNMALFGAAGEGGSMLLLRQDAFDKPEVKAGDAFFGDKLVQAEQDAYSKFAVMDFTPASNLENSIISSTIEKYFRGEATAEEALATIDSDLNSQIGDPYSFN